MKKQTAMYKTIHFHLPPYMLRLINTHARENVLSEKWKDVDTFVLFTTGIYIHVFMIYNRWTRWRNDHAPTGSPERWVPVHHFAVHNKIDVSLRCSHVERCKLFVRVKLHRPDWWQRVQLSTNKGEWWEGCHVCSEELDVSRPSRTECNVSNTREM